MALGAVYRGRAQFRAPVAPAATAAGRRTGKSRGEAARRQTIAERKQAELAAARADAGATTTATAAKSKPGTTTKEEDD